MSADRCRVCGFSRECHGRCGWPRHAFVPFGPPPSEDARASERADVVAWLRAKHEDDDPRRVLDAASARLLAVAIERGAHVGAARK